MARLSSTAKAKLDGQRAQLEAELVRYQKLIRDLRASSESPLVKTQKQREYHRKVQEVSHRLTMLSAR